MNKKNNKKNITNDLHINKDYEYDGFKRLKRSIDDMNKRNLIYIECFQLFNYIHKDILKVLDKYNIEYELDEDFSIVLYKFMYIKTKEYRDNLFKMWQNLFKDVSLYDYDAFYQLISNEIKSPSYDRDNLSNDNIDDYLTFMQRNDNIYGNYLERVNYYQESICNTIKKRLDKYRVKYNKDAKFREMIYYAKYYLNDDTLANINLYYGYNILYQYYLDDISPKQFIDDVLDSYSELDKRIENATLYQGNTAEVYTLDEFMTYESINYKNSYEYLYKELLSTSFNTLEKNTINNIKNNLLKVVNINNKKITIFDLVDNIRNNIDKYNDDLVIVIEKLYAYLNRDSYEYGDYYINYFFEVSDIKILKSLKDIDYMISTLVDKEDNK